MMLGITTFLALATEIQENPVRKVVNMLNMMSKKVEDEGRREEDLFEKYMCYCKTNDAEVSKAVEGAQERIPQLKATVTEAGSMKSQLQTELKDHKEDRAQGFGAIEKANKLHDKEEAQFQTDSTDLKTNIAALKKATKAIRDNLAGSFLQTSAKVMVERVKILIERNGSIDDSDRNMITALLSTGQMTEGSSEEIVGILDTMREEMEKDLAKLEEDEADRAKAHEELIAGKNKEIQSTTSTIESKTERVGVLAVKVSENSDDLEESEKTLVSDQEFLVNLRESCKAQEENWQIRQKTRSEELAAIADTVKILNDDDALDLFNKTLPKPRGPQAGTPAMALIQMHSTSMAVKDRVQKILKRIATNSSNPAVSLIAYSMKTNKVDFSKVTQMIDDLVKVLKDEQKNDDEHKGYCEKEIDTAEDKQKGHNRDVASHSSRKQETEGSIQAIKGEIATLQTGIVDLDKSVAEASAQRKAEHDEYVQTSAENQASLGLIEFAKNRMMKFYNPKLYKAPAAQEMTEEERIYAANGGEVATQAPGGIAGTGIAVIQRAAPPPALPSNYGKGDSGGVTAMMDNLANDIRIEMTEAKTEEKNNQEEYEKLMADSKEKRATDSESITNKEMALATADESLQDTTEALEESKAGLAATTEAIHNLHSECDFLLQNYDTRKTARTQEIEGLATAKGTLAGANFSLVQKGFLSK